MDKLKPFLEGMYRHRFWITCGLVAVASLLTWYMAWSKIEKQRSEWATKLDQKKSSIESVLNSEVETGEQDKTVAVHPNAVTEQAMKERIDKAARGALEAWKERYDKQKALLEFAPELPSHVVDALKAHEPMEKPLERELMGETLRDTYAGWIKKRMPELAKKVQTTWLHSEEDEEKKPAETAGKNQPLLANEPVNLVYWEASNQALWHSKTTEFQGFDGNQDEYNRPTSQQMLALQQDLWILGGMLDVIAEVNQGFTANDLAPIERIDHILVGKDAINPNLGKLSGVEIKLPTTKKKSQEGSGMTTKRGRARSAARASARRSKKGTKFDPSKSSSPFHGRYVNRDYSRLSESDITRSITSEQLTDQSYLAVAKRVPVRIALKMDERRVNDFLAAAANSPFAFEIRQVRINRHIPGEGVERTRQAKGKKKGEKRGPVGPAAGGGGGGGGDGATDVDGPPSGGNGGADGGIDIPFMSEVRGTFDIDIEFIGIVKIYNPVNPGLFFPENNPDDAVAGVGGN